MIAMCLILLPRVGILTWREFERDLGWSNFFIIATSLSLSPRPGDDGEAAGLVLGHAGGRGGSNGVGADAGAADAVCPAFAMLRFILPNIAGYLALVIPVTMAAAESLGLDPLVCGMAAVVVGDSVVYYSAGGDGQRVHLPESQHLQSRDLPVRGHHDRAGHSGIAAGRHPVLGD